MATRLSQKSALTENTAKDDLLMVVDTSDTTSSVDGTSKRIDAKYVIQSDVITVNRDLSTNKKELVAAPGAGYIIQPITVTIIYTYGSSASTVSNYTYIGYDSSLTNEFYARQRDFIRNDTNNMTYIFQSDMSLSANGSCTSSIEDKALEIWSDADLTGDGTLKAIVTYQIVKL